MVYVDDPFREDPVQESPCLLCAVFHALAITVRDRRGPPEVDIAEDVYIAYDLVCAIPLRGVALAIHGVLMEAPTSHYTEVAIAVDSDLIQYHTLAVLRHGAHGLHELDLTDDICIIHQDLGLATP